MKSTKSLSFLILLLVFITACQRTAITTANMPKTVCEECAIVPVSGNLRDLKYGFYYDQSSKKCTRIEYSSGGTAAPFLTMEECIACCQQLKK